MLTLAQKSGDVETSSFLDSYIGFMSAGYGVTVPFPGADASGFQPAD